MTAPRFSAVVQTLGGVSKTYSRMRALAVGTTGNEVVDRVLRGLVDQLRPILAYPRLDATIIRDVSFTAGGTAVVPHVLGRAYIGWSVLRMRYPGAVLGTGFGEVTQTPADLNAVQVSIASTQTCTADVEVW